MKKSILNKKSLIILLIALVLVIALVPSSIVLAKYIQSKKTSGSVTAEFFYVNGDYAQKIEGNQTPQQINVSGWGDGISLRLYNYDSNGTSQSDLTFTYTVTSGYTVTTSSAKIEGGQKGHVDILITPPATAKQGDKVEFALTTAPYDGNLQVVFVLFDSNVADYVIEDKGDYALVTIRTNNYQGAITINYDGTIFAPDNTNPLMADWMRADASNTITVERFCEYQLIFFEEVSVTLTTTSGSGAELTLSASAQ